jgi:dethiobiotin synthetase
LAVKPIETGIRAIEDTDAAKLGVASNPTLAPQHAYAFETPVSPHLAARDHGIIIDPAKVVAWIADRCQRDARDTRFSEPDGHQRPDDWVLVETAGGAFSPISEHHTNLDLAVALEPSQWVLVAPDRLGVLHDMRTTLMAMASVARLPDIVLLSATRVPDASSGTNRRELESLGITQVTGQIPWNGGFNEIDRQRVLQRLTRHPA